MSILFKLSCTILAPLPWLLFPLSTFPAFLHLYVAHVLPSILPGSLESNIEKHWLFICTLRNFSPVSSYLHNVMTKSVNKCSQLLIGLDVFVVW